MERVFSGNRAGLTTRVRVMHFVQIYLDALGRVTHLVTQNEVCSVISVRIRDERDEGLHRCTMWKAHQALFNGTVEPMCPLTFPSDELDSAGLNLTCAAEMEVICTSAQIVK